MCSISWKDRLTALNPEQGLNRQGKKQQLDGAGCDIRSDVVELVEDAHVQELSED